MKLEPFEDLPESVAITWPSHPLADRTLPALTQAVRDGELTLLLLFPNGDRRFVPVAWTDAIPAKHSDPVPVRDATLAALADLRRARAIVDALLQRLLAAEETHDHDANLSPAVSAAPDQPDSSLNTAAHGVSRKPEIIHRLLAANNGSVRETPQGVIRNTLIQNDQQCSAISPRCEPVQQNRNSHHDRIKTCGTDRVRRLPATTHNGATNVPRS